MSILSMCYAWKQYFLLELLFVIGNDECPVENVIVVADKRVRIKQDRQTQEKDNKSMKFGTCKHFFMQAKIWVI
jgi:hypothetical protein